MELHITLNGTRDLTKQITEQLREAISRHIGFSRGVRCSSDDLLVTNGAQQALDLVARVRVDLIPDGTQLIYVTPAHQFPLGMPMSLTRRLALLERARELLRQMT